MTIVKCGSDEHVDFAVGKFRNLVRGPFCNDRVLVYRQMWAMLFDRPDWDEYDRIAFSSVLHLCPAQASEALGIINHVNSFQFVFSSWRLTIIERTRAEDRERL